MYAMNGITLQGSEYEELKLLVDAERNGGDVARLAESRLRQKGDDEDFDDRRCEIYRGLKSAGLISGVNADGGFLFVCLNQKGIDFIDDYAQSEDESRKRTKEQRAHDYKVAAFGAVTGGILGMVGGVLSSQIASAITQALS